MRQGNQEGGKLRNRGCKKGDGLRKNVMRAKNEGWAIQERGGKTAIG